MNDVIAHPVPPVQRLVAATTSWIARVRRRLAAIYRVAWRSGERERLEHDALAGLDERMLKDIGASSWLVESAAHRAREAPQRRIDLWWC